MPRCEDKYAHLGYSSSCHTFSGNQVRDRSSFSLQAEGEPILLPMLSSGGWCGRCLSCLESDDIGLLDCGLQDLLLAAVELLHEPFVELGLLLLEFWIGLVKLIQCLRQGNILIKPSLSNAYGSIVSSGVSSKVSSSRSSSSSSSSSPRAPILAASSLRKSRYEALSSLMSSASSASFAHSASSPHSCSSSSYSSSSASWNASSSFFASSRSIDFINSCYYQSVSITHS
jgi:hypothetical protein